MLGKTISKSRRGVLMGYSAGAGGVFVLLTGVVLGLIDLSESSLSVLLVLLGISIVMWLLALLSFALITEQPGATDGGGNAIEVAFAGLKNLLIDARFRDFVIVRILLLSVALAPPFYVLLAQQWLDNDIRILGYFIIASGIASSISSPFWGKWGDVSSKTVLVMASAGAVITGGFLSIASWMNLALLSSVWLHLVTYMLLIVMHSGVRLGRKVYLVDMATMENRAMYVAVSNTVIGVVMLLFGAVGLLVGLAGIEGIILLLAILSLVASIRAARLDNVSSR